MPSATKKKTTAVVIRKLPVDVHQRLKKRAKERGISTEEEMRSILGQAVAEPRQNPAELLVEFGKKYGPLLFTRDPSPIEPAKFE